MEISTLLTNNLNPAARQFKAGKRRIGRKKIAYLYVKGSQELDFEKRKVIYNEIQQLQQEYVPFIYLVNPLALGAVRNCFEGIQFSALGGAFWNLEELKKTCGGV